MKSQVVLWNKVAQDMGNLCRTSTELDMKTVKLRCQSEGLSFMTITLPTFAKDFEQALDRGWVDHDLFKSFSFRGGLPKFLSGFLGQVFDPRCGVLLPHPSVAAIFAVRQLCYLMAKINLPCSDERVERAIERYVECEHEIKAKGREWTSVDHSTFSRVSRLLFGDCFNRMEYAILHGELLPKHGPGATAGRISGNRKFTAYTWTERLEDVFHWGDYLLPNWRYHQDVSVDFVEPGMEQPVRVITVPKTLKTPRIIAIEPVHMQYMQQAVLRCFLESLTGCLGERFLGFDDQTPNQSLARDGSRFGDLATLDLSEASDRVSNSLVTTMLMPYRLTYRAVMATRSMRADVPGHGVIQLSKFASMGSALCFPFEAMAFLTMIFIGIEEWLSTSLDRRLIQEFEGRVRVYGDDIIVPVDSVPFVVRSLEHFGAKVNADKSFWTGRFRESCGKDYYDGIDVSVIRQRHLVPSRRQHVADVVGTVAFANLLRFDGRFTESVKYLDARIGEVLPHYPFVHPTSPALGKHTLDVFDIERTCDVLHRPLVKAFVVRSRIPKDPLDHIAALTKVLLHQGDEPMASDHLERAGRPDAVDMKLRWTTPY